jgi:hypothetical protein
LRAPERRLGRLVGVNDTVQTSIERMAALPAEARMGTAHDLMWTQLLVRTSLNDRFCLLNFLSRCLMDSDARTPSERDAERDDFARRWRDPMYTVREGVCSR